MFTKISSRDLPKITVKIKNKIIFCEYPQSHQDKEAGLKDRTVLFEHQGMLFNTNGQFQPLFTMRDVLFDLEGIFVGNDYTVKDIIQMRRMDPSRAYTTYKRVPVRYMIEVNKGFTGRYGIKIGDKVSF